MVAIPPSIRLAVYNYRPYFIVVVITGFFLFNRFFEHQRTNIWYDSIKLRNIRILSAFFPVYFVIVSMLKGKFNVPVMGLYIIWTLCSFWLAPLLMQSIADVRKFLVGFLVVNGFLLIITITYTMLINPSLLSPTHQGRLSFGLENPNIFAQVVQAVFMSLVGIRILAPERSKWRSVSGYILLAACILGAFAFAWFARSRNVLLFMLVAGVSYSVLVLKGRRKYLTLMAANTVMVVCALFVFNLAGVEESNKVSSGRLAYWGSLVEALWDGPYPIAAIFVGPASPISVDQAPNRYDALAAEKKFNKMHVDNFYLEQVLESGLIGLLLFLLPYIVMIARSRYDLTSRSSEGRFLCWAISLWIALAYQSFFIPTAPTFNNPIGFFFVIFGIVPVSIIRQKRSDPTARPGAKAVSISVLGGRH
ncbi:hypothetical protein DN745_18135 [Bradymonas sediminis]|uniref:O-antigen ligase-related domain-containing protein n=2 Tax=Bradymonas sediminis TaxID=1548548 RepID=A0A2Z4FPZ8_9DELT|nr:hypothetical protein DN745_18135 [Bradymonas sediminis]